MDPDDGPIVADVPTGISAILVDVRELERLRDRCERLLTVALLADHNQRLTVRDRFDPVPLANAIERCRAAGDLD